MNKLNRLTLVLLVGGLLGGCDTSYHAFDGRSGYTFETLSNDRFAINYYGNRLSSQKDVEVMWHHKARELCKGGAYQHNISANKASVHNNTVVMNTGFIPKGGSHILVNGEVTCLAPSLAIKLNQENELLSDENLASNQLIGGSSAN